MVRKVLMLCVLATSLAAPGAGAQAAAPQTAPAANAQTTPAGASQPAANAVDPASIQALRDMGAFLQTLQRLGPQP